MTLKMNNERVIKKILKSPFKSKPILVKHDGRWHKATACKAKSKQGVRFHRFIRLLRFFK